MKLVELVNYFRNRGSFERFCQNQSLDSESEVIEIFMKRPLDIDNDLAFFEIEKTEGKTQYTYMGVDYSNLFDFYYFLEAIEESNSVENLSLSDKVIAQRLYEYAINDA